MIALQTKNDNSWQYRVLSIGPSSCGKKNTLLNLIQQDNNGIDKVHLHAKDLEEPKYKLLIKKREQAGIKNLNDSTALIEYYNKNDYNYK